ncbi:carbohydrate-binding protein [Chitinophaga agrisoli]|uniref:Carbohydrate-binding protein n=1 Tax=Chitinophaga agrisoli TaxID=2607653 RepID=A0A5B2VP89_9BACT|nr:PQQ-dependent sugar dehydrogenase [Chitinophaga agrisoli]KAA2239899.1 carbohydrate-binding protein [Chitinophaga agrisoli]
MTRAVPHLLHRRLFRLAALLLLTTLFSCTQRVPPHILVFTARDSAATAALTRLQQVSSSQKWALDTTSSADRFTEDSLRQYTAVLFLHMPVDTLDYIQQADLERFIQAGGGIGIINAAPDTVINWPWYNTINQDRLAAAKQPWQTAYDGGHWYFGDLEDEASTKQTLEYIAANGALNYNNATTERVPEENRFVTEVLDTYLYEPMEMVIFKDGKVLFLERRGEVKLYNPATRQTKNIAHFDVSIEGNYEDGMLGVALDPDFDNNHWIYINYSPAGNVPKQNVSRFIYKDDSLYRASEKIVLEIPTQRETCCHSGGHLEFGPGNNLYISAGDNTSSKESDGFSPIDERPGRGPFDAQKSSGNTNDLRGKILRIHPEPNGTYTIPDGNLFPKNGSKGKPEIYVMGTRNAFRFTVDKHNGYVYWGDVGPDGGQASDRGPQSYDEYNQAKKPGNYGWPYFVADNKAYADFDFATNVIGPKFDPARPVNHSPNNTGDTVLPPAQKPMIWYPYGESPEFPILGKGSRSAMAGPVYYYDDFKDAKSRFPKYFDGKLFIYEWARSWVKLVSFDKDTLLSRIAPFLPQQTWYKPIDMKFGPDGALYVLQYGANYFEHNQDSRLVKISYVAGNRRPKAAVTADKSVGAAPLKVQLSAAGSMDYDHDALSYAWDVEGAGANGNTATNTVTYTKPGIYHPRVTVTDKDGQSSTASIEIKVGNEAPQVSISLPGANTSFWYEKQSLKYAVNVTDKEDGQINAGIQPAAVFVSFDHLEEGSDLALLASNKDLAGRIEFLRGQSLVANSDCKSCHNPTAQNIGPAYTAVAQRYKGQQDITDKLADKVLAGGNGNWGKNMMAAHPQHTHEEAREMVKYILSFSQPPLKSLPVTGQVNTGNAQRGNYVFRASYTDHGSAMPGSLNGSALLILRPARVEAEEFELSPKAGVRHDDGTNMTFVEGTQNGAFMHLSDIDLTAIDRLQFSANAPGAGVTIEVHADRPDGPLLGAAPVAAATAFQTVTAPIKGASGRHNVFLVFKGNGDARAMLDWVYFQRKG